MLVYIDQNILSVQASSPVTLSLPGHEVVYSTVHFDEIARSSDPTPYTNALDRLQAKLVKPELKDGLPQDDVKILDKPASELFNEYLEKRLESPVDVTEFWNLLAWLNGGNVDEAIATIPQRIRQYFVDAIQRSAPELPKAFVETLAGQLEQSFEPVISNALRYGNDYQANWARLGADRTGFSQITGTEQLKKIWRIVRDHVPDRSPEAYFGFEWNQGGEAIETPRVLGIVACCGVLDALCFHAEKKRRKSNKQANVQSDAQHVAMASFCDVLFTQDERLYCRAKAIYEFREIKTTAIYLDRTGEPFS